MDQELADTAGLATLATLDPDVPPPLDLDRLVNQTYGELRRLANSMLQTETGVTLQPTALVHEGVLTAMGLPREHWQDPRHFFNFVARRMRRFLVDKGRRIAAARHGGRWKRVEADFANIPAEWHELGLENAELVEQILVDLERQNPRWAEQVHHRLYSGLSIEQTAMAMGLGRTAVTDDWKFLWAYLRARVPRPEGGSGSA